MLRWLAAIVAISAFAACTTGDPGSPLAAAARIEPAPTASASSIVAPRNGPPKDIVDLFDTRMLPTCSLNGGVCHNSKNYPDLRDLAALEDLVNAPCGINVDANLPDACEPPGDRLVASAVDVAIVSVAFDAAAAKATIVTDGDVPRGSLDGVTVRRPLHGGDFVFDASSEGARFESVADRTVAVDLMTATDKARAFFEPTLPLREDHVWPADANGDGVAGASLGWREIVPGRPDRSWIVARLWDTDANPELMPRQCRAWDDDATRALGCWIEGLDVDASGSVTNFFGDIDWARCSFTVPRPGRCGTGLTPDRIVDTQCTGCHGATDAAEGLDLRSASLRASTIGVRSRERPDLALVAAGDPDSSYLFLKVAAGPPATAGERMPKDGALTDAQSEALRSWITAGAP